MRKLSDNMRPSTSFGKALRSQRLAQNLTQTELADLLGVTGTAITSYELGHYLPSPKTFERLQRALPDIPNPRAPITHTPTAHQLVRPQSAPRSSITPIRSVVVADPRIAIAADVINTLKKLRLALPPSGNIRIASAEYDLYANFMVALHQWDNHPLNQQPLPTDDDDATVSE
jgi:transcriptional regulator with XRE-family HTH domain